jgi:hypothetical protein
VARHLIGIDEERIGLVDWLSGHSARGVRRASALARFLGDSLKATENVTRALLDRLGKWAGYLIHFGVIRETRDDRGLTWSVSPRHVAAVKQAGAAHLPGVTALRNALLESYAATSGEFGTRLYLPIGAVRDALGRHFEEGGLLLPDTELDALLRRAPSLLHRHVVSFSPFSGPARGGLKLDNMYAGFMSIRARA